MIKDLNMPILNIFSDFMFDSVSDVLVCSGFYNKMKHSVQLTNNTFVSHSSEGWKSETGCQDGWVKALFKGPDFSLHPHMVEGAKGFFYKSINLIHEALSQRSHLLIQSP